MNGIAINGPSPAKARLQLMWINIIYNAPDSMKIPVTKLLNPLRATIC